MNAIKIVASGLGDNGFYLHDLDVNHNSHVPKSQNYDWYVSFEEINNFGEATLIDHIDYVYFSPNGIWGIVTSDVHSIIGGSQEFIKEVIKHVPDIQDDIVEFIKYWRNIKEDYSELEINIDWLYPLLVDTYGLEKSKKLIFERKRNTKRAVDKK